MHERLGALTAWLAARGAWPQLRNDPDFAGWIVCQTLVGESNIRELARGGSLLEALEDAAVALLASDEAKDREALVVASLMAGGFVVEEADDDRDADGMVAYAKHLAAEGETQRAEELSARAITIAANAGAGEAFIRSEGEVDRSATVEELTADDDLREVARLAIRAGYRVGRWR